MPFAGLRSAAHIENPPHVTPITKASSCFHQPIGRSGIATFLHLPETPFSSPWSNGVCHCLLKCVVAQIHGSALAWNSYYCSTEYRAFARVYIISLLKT